MAPLRIRGCLYSRPESRTDSFTNVGARLGVEKDLNAGLLYASVSSGFRPPQVTELYRLRGADRGGSGQRAVDGLRSRVQNDAVAVAAFVERTRDFSLETLMRLTLAMDEHALPEWSLAVLCHRPA